jgi:hypothetical protein
MPSQVNGIGTTYYGASERQPDGSFVTTEWLILLNIPLVPLRSLRARYLGESHNWNRSSKSYAILGPAPLDKGQVLRAYAWLLIPMILITVLVAAGAAEAAAILMIAGIGFWVLVFPSLYKAR